MGSLSIFLLRTDRISPNADIGSYRLNTIDIGRLTDLLRWL